MKKHKFSITSDGMLPYLQFPDFQSYADSLSLKQMQEWDKVLSQKEIHPNHIAAAIALYTRELQCDTIWLTENEISDLCTKFGIMMGLMHNVRSGVMMMSSGRLSFTNDTAKFKMTDAGIKKVEGMIKR